MTLKLAASQKLESVVEVSYAPMVGVQLTPLDYPIVSNKHHAAIDSQDSSFNDRQMYLPHNLEFWGWKKKLTRTT